MQINKLFSPHFTTIPEAVPTGIQSPWEAEDHKQLIVWPWFLVHWKVQTVFQGDGVPPDSWGIWSTILSPKQGTTSLLLATSVALVWSCVKVPWRSSYALAWAIPWDTAIREERAPFLPKHVKHSEKDINDGFEHLSFWNNSFYLCGNMETSVTAAVVYRRNGLQVDVKV